MNDGAIGDHHLRPAGAPPDWRRSRSESSGAVEDMETSYVPAAACLPGPHRRHYVNHFFSFSDYKWAVFCPVYFGLA